VRTAASGQAFLYARFHARLGATQGRRRACQTTHSARVELSNVELKSDTDLNTTPAQTDPPSVALFRAARSIIV
jgi:hypothetical protein